MGRSPSPSPPLDLAAAIFDAALDDARWPAAVAAATEWVGGAVGALQVRNVAPELSMSMVTCGLEESFERSYAEHYFRVDPHLARVQALQRGKTLLSREVIPDDVLLRSELYNEWCRPQGLRDVQGAVLVSDHQRFVSFATYGPEGRRFDGQTRARLDALVPHLTRAARVDLQLRDGRAARQLIESAAARDRFAALRVDRDRRVVHFHPGAEAFLQRGDGALVIQRRVLTGRDDAATESLRAAIGRALAGRPTTISLGRGVYRPLDIEVTLSPGGGSPSVDVLIFGRPPAAERVGALPPRLRVVGTLLAEGASDKEIAARLEISLQSARTYAARALRKLGLKSRRELMR